MPERTLDRLIRLGLAALVVGIALVGIIYFLDQRAGPGSSLLELRIATAEEAVRDQPNAIGPRLELAELYWAADRLDDALEQYDEVLKAEPGQSIAVLRRGEVLAAKGDLAEAVRSFEEIIGQGGDAEFAAVDPQLEAAYYGLGSAMLERGEARKAIAALDEAVGMEPTDADAWYLLGEAALEAGAPRRAVEALREAVRFVPTEWCEPYERLGDAYQALDRRAHAEYAGAMVDLCEERPGDAARRLEPLTTGPAGLDAMLGLGLVAEFESDRAGATRWYRKVAAADAENFNALSGLNRLGVALHPGAGRSSQPGDHPPTAGTAR